MDPLLVCAQADYTGVAVSSALARPGLPSALREEASQTEVRSWKA